MFPIVVSSLSIVRLENKLQDRIKHAKSICLGYEDTKECRVAWDNVEDIQKAINKKKETHPPSKSPSVQCEVDELACREYDV
jgi:hypothetical protein